MELDNNKVILALDTPDRDNAIHLLQSLKGLIQQVKIGPVLFLKEGPSLIDELNQKGYKVFLDLKLHDIPNTVALAVKSAKKLGVWMLSLHLSGGKKMLEQAAREAGKSMLLVGITVLTSLGETDLPAIGIPDSLENQVVRLGRLANEAGLRAVVASPKEVHLLRETLFPKTILVAPGIRWEAGKKDDQTRTLSPREAIQAGADYLVIGRPILQARNPRQAVINLLESLKK